MRRDDQASDTYVRRAELEEPLAHRHAVRFAGFSCSLSHGVAIRRPAVGCGGWPAGTRLCGAVALQKLHLKAQDRTSMDVLTTLLVGAANIAVRQVRWHEERPLVADSHEL